MHWEYISSSKSRSKRMIIEKRETLISLFTRVFLSQIQRSALSFYLSFSLSLSLCVVLSSVASLDTLHVKSLTKGFLSKFTSQKEHVRIYFGEISNNAQNTERILFGSGLIVEESECERRCISGCTTEMRS